MARIRTVKPEFFKHYDLFSAEKETGLPLRLAFQGLWIVADKEGRFKYLPPQLKLDVLPYDEVDFAKVLQELEKRGFIESYECNGGRYGWIPTFKDHQRITGSEAVSESKIPEPPKKQLGNAVETPEKQEGIHLDDRKGREGKGREKERKGEEGVPSSEAFLLEGVIWDIEAWLIQHEKHFDSVCVQAKKPRDEVLIVLKKFHLWNQNKEIYPKKPLPLIAGLQSWLLNEKNYKNATSRTNNSNSAPTPTIVTQAGTRDF